MGGLHGFVTMHWEHEPTPDPSQEGNWPTSEAPLLGGAGGGLVCARFMESPHLQCLTRIGTMNRRKTSNIELRTPNSEWSALSILRCSVFDVRCSMFRFMER